MVQAFPADDHTDINLATKDGITALMCAAGISNSGKGGADIVRALLADSRTDRTWLQRMDIRHSFVHFKESSN